MTIGTDVVPRITYPGTGTQTVFPYPWLVLDPADLAVYQNGTLKVLGSHYTLSGVGAAGGGNVTFSLAPASGEAIALVRVTQATQPASLGDTGPAAMTTIERGLDRLTMLVQELDAAIGRIPQLDIFSTRSGLSLTDPVAGYLLRWRDDLTGLEGVNPTLVLPGNAPLPLAVTNGGTGATSALGARQALGLDGQVVRVLANQTGVTLVAGDVVRFDPANDSTVVLDDTVASKALKAVALGTIPTSATGAFVIPGVVAVNVTGSVVRGRYLRKSATTKVAEDSGVLAGPTAEPPAGAFAIALTGSAAGQVLAYCFGITFPGSTAPIITGLGRLVGASGGNSSGSPTAQFDLAATSAVLRDPIGGGTLVLPTVATRTADVSLAGPIAGGRDQAGAFSANSWLYRYLIGRTDGTYALLWSLTPPPTGPTLPVGYTLWAYAGAHRLDNSSQLTRLRLRGGRTRLETQAAVLTNGAAVASSTVVSVATVVPPAADAYDLRGTTNLALDGSGIGQIALHLQITSGLDAAVPFHTWNSTASALQVFSWAGITLPNVTQQFLYFNAVTFGSTPQTSIWVGGYEESL